MSWTHLTELTSLMISMENPVETLPQIFYPNASRNMGLWCLSWVFHCLDTRRPPAPFYERVEPDMEFCLNFVNSVTLFYKSFVLPCLLGYRDIFDCLKCNKAIFEEDEISESAKGKVFAAMCWSHYEYCRCTGFLGLPELRGRCSKCNWQSWWWWPWSLQESEATVTSVDVNHVCPVCSMTSIPVDGEHVCSVCKKAVHAWCSNHEKMTSSADLICNLCISD